MIVKYDKVRTAMYLTEDRKLISRGKQQACRNLPSMGNLAAWTADITKTNALVQQKVQHHMRPPTQPPRTAVRLRTSSSSPLASYSRCTPAPTTCVHSIRNQKCS